MTNRNKAHRKSVYFIGIGGIGMSALARWFLAQNWAVSGSDLAGSRILQELKKEGVKVKIGHKKANFPPKIGLVVYSLAVKSSNPEFRMARRLKIPTLSYSEVIGELTRMYKTVAVAGAHGKSTTTALVGLILTKAGLDPTIIVGTNVKEFGGKNFRSGHSHNHCHGHSGYLVLEADEFGRAFLHYSPTIAVVTNIDREHLDTYKNLTGVKKAFLKFLHRTKNGGILILNKDSQPLFSLYSRIQKLSKERGLKVIWYSATDKQFKKIKAVIKIAGRHNISNALAAYAIGRVLKIPEAKILSAIANYRGAWRRMEYRGRLKMKNEKLKIKVLDDYAHHPTEIKATLGAFHEKFPHSPVICVFQPHQAERLRLLFKEFTAAFDNVDVLILLPAYMVAGRDRINPRFTSEKLAEAVRKKYPGKPIAYLGNPKNIKSELVKIIGVLNSPSRRSRSKSRALSPIVVMMGAGDIVKYTDSLLK